MLLIRDLGDWLQESSLPKLMAYTVLRHKFRAFLDENTLLHSLRHSLLDDWHLSNFISFERRTFWAAATEERCSPAQ